MAKKKVQSRKVVLDRLSKLCIKHFGKDFEHWYWNCGTYKQPLIKATIELPKVTIEGENKYTDPFTATSGGYVNSLCIAAKNALSWMYSEFEY